ncbi:MAG: response regulator [Elusimicrobia bacterium]|nr:response regulator [Elusimicrobiota bacterium]
MPHDSIAPHVPPPADAVPPRLDRAAVPIVDDDRNYGPFLIKALASIGVGSTLVIDGISALKTAMAIRPRLVLLDLNLPALHGFQVLRSLRNDRRTADTRIIMITAEQDLNRSLWNASDALRANGFFTKAWDWKMLMAMTRHELSAKVPSRMGLVLDKDGIGIDVPKQSVVVDGRDCLLRSRVCLFLFAALLDHDGPASPEHLLRQVWPRGESLGLVATTAHRLKKRLKALGIPVTVKKVELGYQLERPRTRKRGA